MVEINLGYCKSLETVYGSAKDALARLTHLEMRCDVSCKKARSLLEFYLGSKMVQRLSGWQQLTVNSC